MLDEYDYFSILVSWELIRNLDALIKKKNRNLDAFFLRYKGLLPRFRCVVLD
jgi:hypothetical protein